MKKFLFISPLILISVLCSCNGNVAKPKYLDASDVTKKYIEKLFILNDYTTAYNMMADEFKASVSQDEFKKISFDVHKNIFPKNFEINGFETYSDQELISILVVTKNYSPQLYYRVTLLGTSKKGYVIAGLDVRHKPIKAKGNRVPINPPITIGGA